MRVVPRRCCRTRPTPSATSPPTARQFEARDLRYGGEIVEAYRGTGTCLGGMIDGGRAPRRRRWCPRWRRPPRRPAASRSDIYAARQGAHARRPRRRRAGSTACSSTCTARWCRRAWTTARATCIAAVRARGRARRADRGHARLPRQRHAATWSRGADLLHGYKTYPHVDMAERGVEAAARLAEVIAGRLRPTAACRQPPLLPPLGSQGTARGPMRRLYDLADEMEKRPRGASRSRSSPASRSPTSPTPGLGVYVVTERRPGPGRARSPTSWRASRGSIATSSSTRALPVTDAVARGARRRGPARSCSPTWPTTPAAAPPATAPRSCASCCGWARAARRWPASGTRRRCAACVTAGVGATVTLDVGGKVDDRHGAPARRHRARAHAVRRPLRPQGADDRAGSPGRLGHHGGARRERREGHPHLAPLADARPGDDPLRRHRPARGEDPRRQVHHPLPRGLRADRPARSSRSTRRGCRRRTSRASPSRACAGRSSRSIPTLVSHDAASSKEAPHVRSAGFQRRPTSRCSTSKGFEPRMDGDPDPHPPQARGGRPRACCPT